MYWKCNDTKYQIQMITANFWPAMQLTQSSKFWRKKTDLQITPYIYPKKFCIISYNMDNYVLPRQHCILPWVHAGPVLLFQFLHSGTLG